MIPIIGIAGKAGSGKDTLANLVFLPRGYRQWAFAWPLKMMALSHGFTYEEIFVTKPPQAREWLQEYGQRKRDQNPDFWVEQTDGWLRTLPSLRDSKVVITDVRYQNEVDFIRSRGGRVIRMEHGFGLPYTLRGSAAAMHPSETALDECNDFDLTIHNHLVGNPLPQFESACRGARLIHDVFVPGGARR